MRACFMLAKVRALSLSLSMTGKVCGRALSLSDRQRGCMQACFMEKKRGREREREKHGEGERGGERKREREKEGERCRICPELFNF